MEEFVFARTRERRDGDRAISRYGCVDWYLYSGETLQISRLVTEDNLATLQKTHRVGDALSAPAQFCRH